MAKLEKLLGKVDACQQRLARIPVLLKRFRQSVLAAACSGRLTADWREKNEAEEPAEVTLADMLDDMRTGPFESALHKSDYVTDGIPVINPVNMIAGCIVPSMQTTVSQAIPSID